MRRFQPVLLFLTVLSSALAGAPAALGQDGAEPVRIVAFGDSLVAGYGLSPGEAFPAQLQARLTDAGYAVEIANAGVSGDTSADGLSRLDWSVPIDADLVIVELGANDALRGLPPETTRANIEAILARLSERPGRVILAGMIAPPNMGGDYSARFNAIFPELADAYGATLYPFFLEGVAAEASLNQDDAIHPNAQGVSAIVERMLPLVAAEIDAIRNEEPAAG